MKKLISLIASSLFIIIGIAFSGCILDDSIMKVNYTAMTEYYTEDGVLGFRCINGHGRALGFIKIDGITVDAFYDTTGFSCMVVTILYSEDFKLSETAHQECFIDNKREGKYYHDEFSGHYADGVITTKNLKLFGQDFGCLEIKSRAIDPATVNASEYLQQVWKSEDGKLNISTNISAIVYLPRGTARTDEGERKIMFKWCSGNRFEIYSHTEQYVDRELLSWGTYTNNQSDAELKFEADALFGLAGQTMKLKGEDIYK